MNLLLKLDGYPPAVLVALLLHGGILLFLLDRTMSPDNMVEIKPAAVAVSMARENPQRLRRIEEVRQAQAAEQRSRDEARAREQAAREREATQRAEAERRQAEERQKAQEQQRQADARRAEEERQAAARRQAQEAERQRQAEAQRQQQAREEAERQARAQAQANANAQRVENDLVAQYTGIIQSLITQNWVIPPSARNGMVALVELRTTPVGDIVSSRILQSSGDARFDSSVLDAVARVGNLQELRDLPTAVYERNFRTFNLQFKPEDLLR